MGAVLLASKQLSSCGPDFARKSEGLFLFCVGENLPKSKKFEKSLLNGVFVLCSAAIGMAGHVVGKGR